MKRNKTEFTILPAYHGDCILIKTYNLNNEEFIILIDGGTANTFKYQLKDTLKDIVRINLLILTHVDSDHIAGLISLFKSSVIETIAIDEIWINHPEIIEVNSGELISTVQGDNLKNLIDQKLPKVLLSSISTSTKEIDKNGIKIFILSPTLEILKELYDQWSNREKKNDSEEVTISAYKKGDRNISLFELSKQPFKPDKAVSDDIFNASSIAFLLVCRDVSLLLLADARPEVIVESLSEMGFNGEQPLTVDYVKVSHHGSLNNTSQEALRLIKSNNYIISTNGGTANHKFPSRETIARIVYNANRTEEKLQIFFNYSIAEIIERIGNIIDGKDFENGNWIALQKNIF